MPLNLTISSELFTGDSADQEVLIRESITIQRLIAEIRHEFSLTGQRYTLRHGRSNRLLDPQRTLEEQGVRENDTLIFAQGSKGALRAETGELIQLRSDTTIIGRPNLQSAALTNRVDIDLTPFDPTKTTSRPHARITVQDERYFVESLNEKNLTYVNDQAVPFGKKQPIADKDVLRLGKVRLTFLLLSE